MRAWVFLAQVYTEASFLDRFLKVFLPRQYFRQSQMRQAVQRRQLSTALGYHSTVNLVWATAIAFLVGDQAGTLELGRRAIHRLQWGGDRLRMGITLHIIAGTLAATRPEAAAIILGAAEAHVLESARTTPLTARPTMNGEPQL